MNTEKRPQDDYFRKLVRPCVLEAHEYSPPPDCGSNIVKLSANENDLGAAPAVYRAVMEQLENEARLNRYPDSTCSALRDALSKKFGLPAGWFVVGNGLDDVIGMLSMTFLGKDDEVLIPAMTFGVYEGSAKLLCARTVTVPMKRDLSIDVDGIIGSLTGRSKMVFLCSPNNPTGTTVKKAEFERLLDAASALSKPPLIVADQAYVDYAEPNGDCADALDYIESNKNIIALRTFSKISGLAGLRTGYAIAHPELLAYVNRVRPPFTVNSLAQAAAIADTLDKSAAEFKNRAIQSVRKNKEELEKFLDKSQVVYVKSDANFVFAFYDMDYPRILEISRELLKRSILVRTLKHEHAPSGIRFTIGTDDENKKLIAALEDILS